MKKSEWLTIDHDLGDLGLVDEDLVEQLGAAEAAPGLFGRISLERFCQDLEQRGLLDRLRRRGYRRFWPELQREDAFHERVLLWAEHADREQPVRLMDVKSQRGSLESPWGERYRVLVWEWIEMSDPLAPPSPYRPTLPGQKSPGLGLFRGLTALMLEYVESLDLEALAAVPEYFHNAVLYSSHFLFLEASVQGEFQAMCRDLLHDGLAPASWWMARGEVDIVRGRDGERRPYVWSPHTIVRPMAPSLQARLASAEYRQTVERTMEEVEFCRREVLDFDSQPAL